MDWWTRTFELPRGGAAPTVRPMEGLRAIGAGLVFLGHYVGLMMPLVAKDADVHAFAQLLRPFVAVGVDLFFVLSGYLLYKALITRQRSYGSIIKARVRRLYPTFLVVFAAYVVLSIIFPAYSRIPAGAWDAALYLGANLLMLPGLFPIAPMNSVTWSLSFEMAYALTIPLIVAAFALRDRPPAWRVRFFVTLLVLLAVFFIWLDNHIRMGLFIAGILLYEAERSPRISTPSQTTGLLALLAAMLLTTLAASLFDDAHERYLIQSGATAVAFPLLFLACFRNPQGWLARALSNKLLCRFGNISFSYYLIHALTVHAALMVIGPMLPAELDAAWILVGLIPPMFALTLLTGGALFVLVERPFSLAHKAAANARNRIGAPAAAGSA